MYKTTELFDLDGSIAGAFLRQFEYPWQALEMIGDLVKALGGELDPAEYDQIAPRVWVHRSASVAPTVSLNAPCIIGARSELRHCAFVRGNVIVGADCVVGNSVELKNAILFDDAQVCHFNYVGDSILGSHAHMGAGAITSNVKLDNSNVMVRDGEMAIDVGLWKFGAMIGDHGEIGCNSVLNPGTIIGRNSTVYPLSSVRGILEENCILKNNGSIVKKRQNKYDKN